MDSRIASELKLRYAPVAISFADERPAQAIMFEKGKRGCVISMLSAAAKGRTVAFDRETVGCFGGKVGLCFGEAYADFPGGIEWFLSVGRPGFREGEGYRKTVELARASVDNLPKVDIPQAYVVFRPLSEASAATPPMAVCFYANPDQLSALVVLANYGRPGRENVLIPAASGCQEVVLLPYLESQRDEPRAVVGMTDISARPYIDPDLLTFTVPWRMYEELEGNVAGSFLEKAAWKKVAARLE